MSKYQDLCNRGVDPAVKKGAREVIITTISSMCDNIHRLTLKKNGDGDFKLSGNGNALSNWSMAGDYKTDIEWAADDGDWKTVFKTINTGHEVVESVRSR